MKSLPFFILITFFSKFSFAAYLGEIKGDVFVKNQDALSWNKLDENVKGIKVKNKDEIRTARASSAEIIMDDGSRVKIAPFSYFRMEEESPSSVKLNLIAGKVRNWVKKFSKKFEIKTPTAVCAVRGTDFMVAADIEGNTKVEVYDGSVLTGDSKGAEILVKKGEMIDIGKQGLGEKKNNPNPPQEMASSLGDKKEAARKELYGEISKDAVIKQAQAEMQSAEYQNRKTAIDAYGLRVRMEEYIVRPAENQFKYVVLNTRKDSFNFGKILFTFNSSLPKDLTQATKNMLYYEGSAAPQWYLTEMNSVISNTYDKVTEDAWGGKMVPDNASAPETWTHFFANYGVYFAGPSQSSENGGLGRLLWKYSDSNNNNIADSGEFTFLGNRTVTAVTSLSSYQKKYDFNDGSSMIATKINPSGDDVFDNIVRNEYSDGTWINTRDYLLFDDGKVASFSDFSSSLGGTSKSDIADRLNFERVYESSLFQGRKIDLEFSAKLLKDAGLLKF
ncbi:MAG: FecR domain-containing protein [Elusimicrobia bacterium]|nr:FecR domain-containing protein [Elusimicrobiota bacterium]